MASWECCCKVNTFAPPLWAVAACRKRISPAANLLAVSKKATGLLCPARTVKEYVLHAAVVQAVNEVYAQRDAYLPQLKANIEKVLGEDNSGPVAEVDAKIADLQQELLKKAKANQDYEMLGKEIIRLREEKYQLQLEDANREGIRQKVAELETCTENWTAR